MRKCIDCGFWFSFYSCRECSKPLCGVCVDWPSPRLHSPGKGMCETCREKPTVLTPPHGKSGTLYPRSQQGEALVVLTKQIKKIGEEIEARQHRAMIAEKMLFAPPDWQKREVIDEQTKQA